MNTKFTLGVIGAGNMANAIVSGAIKKLLKPNEIIISDKDETKLKNFKELGFNVTADNVEVVKNSENLLFAVKPQIAPIVFEDIKGKTKEKLMQDKENAYFSYELATIYKEVPLEINLEDTYYEGPNIEELNKIYNELEFYSLLKKEPKK